MKNGCSVWRGASV